MNGYAHFGTSRQCNIISPKKKELNGWWRVMEELKVHISGERSSLKQIHTVFSSNACSGMFNSETPWTVACQAPVSMVFPKQKYWSRFPFPTPGDLPKPGTEPASLASPALAGELLTMAPSRYSSNSMTFWKRQNYGDSNKSVATKSWGMGEMNRQRTKDAQANENTLEREVGGGDQDGEYM